MRIRWWTRVVWWTTALTGFPLVIGGIVTGVWWCVALGGVLYSTAVLLWIGEVLRVIRRHGS